MKEARLGPFANGFAWWVTHDGKILARGWHEDNKVARQQLREAVAELSEPNEFGQHEG